VTVSPTPGDYAADIERARDELVEVARRCPEATWGQPLSDEDPRSVGVVVDHVADAYDYIGDFIRQLTSGGSPQLDGDVIDALNLDHATRAGGVSLEEAVAHLSEKGDAVVQLVAGLSAGDLAAGDGRVARLAGIAARHADNHRAEIEAATAGGPGG